MMNEEFMAEALRRIEALTSEELNEMLDYLGIANMTESSKKYHLNVEPVAINPIPLTKPLSTSFKVSKYDATLATAA